MQKFMTSWMHGKNGCASSVTLDCKWPKPGDIVEFQVLVEGTKVFIKAGRSE